MVKKDIHYIIRRILICFGVGILFALSQSLFALDVHASNNFQLDRSDVNRCSVPSNCGYFSGFTGDMWDGSQGATSIVYNIGNIEPGYYDVSFLIQSKYNYFYSNYNNNNQSLFYTNNNIQYLRLVYNNVHYFGDLSPYGTYVFKGYFDNFYLEPNTTIQVVVQFKVDNNIQLNGTNGTTTKVSFVYDPIANGNNEIVNAIDQQTQAQEDTNDLLNDNNVSSDTSDSIDDVLTYGDSQSTFGPVADLLLLPLTLFGAYYTSFGGSCSSYNLGTMFNHQIVLPCINLENILGSSLYSIIDVAISLFMIYNIILMCISSFDKITSLSDPFDELFKPGGGIGG